MEILTDYEVIAMKISMEISEISTKIMEISTIFFAT